MLLLRPACWQMSAAGVTVTAVNASCTLLHYAYQKQSCASTTQTTPRSSKRDTDRPFGCSGQTQCVLTHPCLGTGHVKATAWHYQPRQQEPEECQQTRR